MTTTPATGKTPAKKAPAAKKTPQQLLSEARGKAVSKVLDAHRDEFNEAMAAFAKELGVKWNRKPTPAEKRKAALAALLAEDPSLAEEAARIAQGRMSTGTSA